MQNVMVGCLVQVGNGIELEAVGLQFEPYRLRPCGVTWESSPTVVVIKLRETSALKTNADCNGGMRLGSRQRPFWRVYGLYRCVRRKATRVVSPHAVSTGGSPDINGRERRQGREDRRHLRSAGCIEVVSTARGTSGGSDANGEDTFLVRERMLNGGIREGRGCRQPSAFQGRLLIGGRYGLG